MTRVEEILQKEEEKHQLMRLGVVSDWQKAVKRAVADGARFHDASAGFVKHAFLHYFYQTILCYGRFIDREKHTNELLKKRLYAKTQAFVAARRREQPAPLDRELKTGSQLTVAYLLSENIYDALYTLFCLSGQSFDTPCDAEDFFRREAGKKYPLHIDDYVEALKDDDRAFWETTCLYLQDLSARVARMAPGRAGKTGYLDMVSEDTWTKAYEILKTRLAGHGRVPVFRSGTDFRNYLIQICHFLADNLYRKYAGRNEVYIEDVFPYYQSDTETGEETAVNGYAAQDSFADDTETELHEHGEHEIKELEVDTDNPYEVAYAVSIILLNPGHALHRALTEDIEDKVTILMDRSLHGKSYNEITADLCGALPDDAFRRAVAKARKDCERVRKILTDRLIGLVRQNEEKKRVTVKKIAFPRHIPQTRQIMY
jgi:DNA-directed RNA polymerase specialized sigma24 family protein